VVTPLSNKRGKQGMGRIWRSIHYVTSRQRNARQFHRGSCSAVRWGGEKDGIQETAIRSVQRRCREKRGQEGFQVRKSYLLSLISEKSNQRWRRFCALKEGLGPGCLRKKRGIEEMHSTLEKGPMRTNRKQLNSERVHIVQYPTV